MVASLSASGLRRAEACPAAYALPLVHSRSEDARRGTNVHSYLEQLALGTPREDALAEVPADVRALCEGIDPREIPRGGVPEQAMAYDTATGRARLLEVTSHRGYAGLAPTEIPGTADLVVVEPERVRVIDWKTTRWDFDVATAQLQLRFLALAAARAHGVLAASCEVGVIGTDGGIGWYREELDWEGLNATAARVRSVVERVRAERSRTRLPQYTPDTHLGDHCRYCDAEWHCPAARAAVARVRSFTPDALAALTPEQVAGAYEEVKAAERAVEHWRAVAKRLASQGPMPIGDGRSLQLDGRGALVPRRDAA